MTTVDDLTADIAELLDTGMSAAAVARELIVPLNDVLTVQQQRRHAPPAPSASPPSSPRLAVVRPSGEPDVTTPPPTSNLDLISRAQATGVPRLQRLAEKAQAAFDSLAAELEEHEAKSEARATVERLERELAQAKAALRPGRDAGPTAATSRPDTKAIRAWAREQGVDVPDRGTLPARIVEDYQREHPA